MIGADDLIRTQVSLTESQMERLREVAARRGLSIAQVVRDAVDAELARDAAGDRVRLARETVGAYRSGRHDVAREHDEYLAEALGARGEEP